MTLTPNQRVAWGSVHPLFGWWHSGFAPAYHALGRQADAERGFRQFQSRNGDREAYEYIQLNAQYGGKPAALQWLEKAYRLRDPSLQIVNGDWLLDPIRDEPRFKAILARMNSPP